MAVLPTNYLDDILAASMGGKRRFRITHEDGSTEEVTLEDVSEYEQVGSPFGSGDVNKTNQAVNEKLDSADVVDPALATVLGFAADAKLTGDALSELNKNMQNLYMPKGNYKFMVHWGKASNDACRCCLPYAKNPNDKITLVSSGFQVWDSGTFNICFYTTNTNLENTVDYIEFTIS